MGAEQWDALLTLIKLSGILSHINFLNQAGTEPSATPYLWPAVVHF